ncbi:hypothetical protein ABZP36_013011 [Zizania latifolia]
MAAAVVLRLAPSPPRPKPPRRRDAGSAGTLCRCGASRRDFAVHTGIAIAIASAAAAVRLRPATAAEEAPTTPPPPAPQNKKGSPVLGGIVNTRSWSQYYGSGFSIRVPPSFDDILEPEDFNVGMTYYGDKAKPRTYAARFASTDRSELVSVVIKPSNQLKITFLEAKDITDLGTLMKASKIFVPGDYCHLRLQS